MNSLLWSLVLALGAVCDPVPEVHPSFEYDAARCDGYRIVSAPRRFVGEKVTWGLGICDNEGHPWTVAFADTPASFRSMLDPTDPNTLIIGVIPDVEGVHYILFTLSDQFDSRQLGVLVYARQNRAPRIHRVKRWWAWLFGN